jgi:hypothetical protein
MCSAEDDQSGRNTSTHNKKICRVGSRRAALIRTYVTERARWLKEELTRSHPEEVKIDDLRQSSMKSIRPKVTSIWQEFWDLVHDVGISSVDLDRRSKFRSEMLEYSGRRRHQKI